MPVRTEADLRLAQFVETVHGFPGVEDVISGRGLERLYAFVTAEAGRPAEAKAAEIMADLTRGDTLATETARLFARLLGAEVGNLALIHLPFGGIYIIGGVARAFLPFLGQMGFSDAFRDKGRFAGFMANFAVAVVEDDFAALTGCAAYLAAGAKG
jgi:glucokinase